jgi:P27 family predicted phage terminase small subunit
MAGNRNSGRRPKPTALHVLRGNPSKKKLNQGEPKPPEGAVSVPETASIVAKVVWSELAPVALAMGTLTTADIAAFTTLCELEATFRLACAEKDRPGFSPFLHTTMVDSAGNEHQNIKEHPAIKLERSTAGAMRPYYEKFGLEPVGRARIAVPQQEQPLTKWEAIGL